MSKMLGLIVAFLVAAEAADPAPTWISWTHAACPAGTAISHLSAETVVPPPAPEGGGQPALWFGIEDPANVNLLQPILPAWGQCEEDAFCVFNEQFRWHGMQNWDGEIAVVQEGDRLYASLDLARNGSYIMTISVTGSINTTIVDVRPPSVLENMQFVNAYFVIEHRAACQQLPLNGIVYSNIDLQCNGSSIPNPNWTVESQNVICDMEAKVDPSGRKIAFSWNSE